MRRDIISSRPGTHLSETIVADEASPRLSADCGNALSPLYGRADAKQPGETASRLLRIASGKSQGHICWRRFAVLKSLFSAGDFSDSIALHLLNIDLHLLQIARSRARRDFEAVTQEAHAIGRIAANLGAVHVNAAARVLEQACEAEDHAATYRLIGALSHACDQAGAELNIWLALNSAIRWS